MSKPLVPGLHHYSLIVDSVAFNNNRANEPQVDLNSGALLGGGDPYNGIAMFGSGFPEAARGRLPQ